VFSEMIVMKKQSRQQEAKHAHTAENDTIKTMPRSGVRVRKFNTHSLKNSFV